MRRIKTFIDQNQERGLLSYHSGAEYVTVTRLDRSKEIFGGVGKHFMYLVDSRFFQTPFGNFPDEISQFEVELTLDAAADYLAAFLSYFILHTPPEDLYKLNKWYNHTYREVFDREQECARERELNQRRGLEREWERRQQLQRGLERLRLEPEEPSSSEQNCVNRGYMREERFDHDPFDF